MLFIDYYAFDSIIIGSILLFIMQFLFIVRYIDYYTLIKNYNEYVCTCWHKQCLFSRAKIFEVGEYL